MLKHSRLSVRMMGALFRLLEDRPCEVFNSKLRVRVRVTGFAAYPDISVACDHVETDPEDEDTLTNPVILVEVLSKSTEKRDRGTKWTHYRLIPSLRDYLIVSQKEPHIEHYARNADGSWTLRDVMPPNKVHLSAGGELDLVDLYRERLAL
jgi:Uma2 family endonuclease